MSFPRKQESSIQHIWGSEAIEARAERDDAGGGRKGGAGPARLVSGHGRRRGDRRGTGRLLRRRRSQACAPRCARAEEGRTSAARSTKSRKRKLDARDRRRSLDACRTARARRQIRRLLAEADGKEPLLRQRQRAGPHHDDRRGAGPRRGSARQALCRPRRAIARPHARGDRPHRGARLHHQHGLLAPAGKSHADA